MAEAAEYREWTIEPQSYEADGELWHPKASVTTHKGGSVLTVPIVAHLDITFATEAAANAYAVEMAKKWIDERS
jgi:hypothetical protein